MIAGLTLAYIVLTPLAIWLPVFPPTVEAGHWTPGLATFMAPAIVILAFASVIETFRSRQRSNVVDAWMSLIAFGVIVEMYMTAIGSGRFTIGWYASRFVIVFATSAVLGVLLIQAACVYAELIERAVVLEGEAHTDTLSGLPNRRRFDEEFAPGVRPG